MARRVGRFRVWVAAASAGLGAIVSLVRGEVPQTQPAQLFRHEIEIADLVKTAPPKFANDNKRLVHELAHPAGVVHTGQIVLTQWKSVAPPATFPKAVPTVTRVDGFFTYGTSPKGSTIWHLNFADPSLFAFYGGSPFAQDEMQVAEHPVLASVREWMLAKKLPARTVTKDGPTPVLVESVPRRVMIATGPDAKANRPEGLYGNRFGKAPADVVRAAVVVLDPPTLSNIIAVAAPWRGSGRYSREELERVLLTAYTGFRAARERSGESKCVIHTGFWGCGAFGGNRTVMVALQIAAARAAGVDEIVFHTGDGGEKDFANGRAAYEKAAAAGTTAGFVDAIEKAGYRWGVSDGN